MDPTRRRRSIRLGLRMLLGFAKRSTRCISGLYQTLFFHGPARLISSPARLLSYETLSMTALALQ